MRIFSPFERTRVSVPLLALLTASSAVTGDAQLKIPDQFPFLNPSGVSATHNTAGNGQIDTNGPFFQSLGTNGRSCNSCHKADQGWTISADGMKLLFALTAGTDPVFRTVDGSNCDQNIDTSTLSGRVKAYSLLTSRGLIRIALAVPAGAEYKVVGCIIPPTAAATPQRFPLTDDPCQARI